MESKYRVALWCVLCIVIVGLIYLCRFYNETTQEHKVYSIDKVENTTGDSEGFTTEVYYFVTTDKGAYKIVMDGFNAAPHCARIQKDSSYLITTRGIKIPFLGIYPNIIEVKNN